MRFDATLITPVAPTAIAGSVIESSPLRIATWSGSACRSWLNRSIEPPASLIATMFAYLPASPAIVSTPISPPVRPGTL